jgi:N-terminal half of MaoC dehydratase
VPRNSFPIESGQIMMFAQAIGDPNPIYRDPAYAAERGSGVVIAPPTFVQSSVHWDPDYPLRPKIGQPWFGSGRNDTGIDGDSPMGHGSLHAEQHFEYSRAIRVGDVLHAEVFPGKQWEKQGRSGRLIFFETITDYTDQAGGLVVRARSISVRTDRSSAGRVVQP